MQFNGDSWGVKIFILMGQKFILGGKNAFFGSKLKKCTKHPKYHTFLETLDKMQFNDHSQGVKNFILMGQKFIFGVKWTFIGIKKLKGTTNASNIKLFLNLRQNAVQW